MRVGESTRTANRERRAVDLVERLRSVLDAQGITVVDPREDGSDGITGAVGHSHVGERNRQPKTKRRVSFDDAHLEETWLSEHSESVNPHPRPPQTNLLSLPPRRGRGNVTTLRARSISFQRSQPIRNAAPKYSQHASHSTGHISEAGDHVNPTLLFEPSQTQLEQNAEAVLSTSTIRSSRQALRAWHDAAVQHQQARSRAYSTAAAHDRRTLLKQALDQWRATLDDKQQENRRQKHFDRLEERAQRYRDRYLVSKAFRHWATSCRDEKIKTSVASRYILKVRYFKRWRAIASENQIKVRSILVRKYFAVWREKRARRQTWQEQAVAHYEEALTKRCKTNWFWQFCSRRVEGWHEQWVERRMLGRLASSFEGLRQQQRQAEEFYQAHLTRCTLNTLCNRLKQRQQDNASAQQQHARAIAFKSLHSIQIQAELAPIARTVTLRVTLDLQRRALRAWHLHLTLARQAAEVDRKRLLQTAWTDWNDALRCKALAQKVDERVLVENLYRWVLHERLRLFQRTADGRFLGRALEWWQAKVHQERDRLADAEIVFAERQRRRRLVFGMIRLNVAMRDREDAERAALEFANSKALPKVLDTWKEKTDHSRRLAKWAADARFYYLCSSTLKVWKERTSEHQQNRRRNAYAQVRARMKIRLVGQCFMRLRTKGMEVHSMDGEAERRAQARATKVCTTAFDRWREQSAQYAELDAQATAMDRRKLLASALSAMILKHADLAGMEQQALDFERESDLSVLAGALRRIQWATFTVARKVESAEALWARNRDQHVRHMLRHWVSQAAARRRTERRENQGRNEELESPSLRPASRTASRSADLALPSSPPTQGALPSTPGYMRTPSRSRRAGRFRPLPTPAPFTPMSFNSAYLATTPAPVPTEEPDDQPFGGGVEALMPQVTPFERKLRAGGFAPVPPSALRGSIFGRSVQGGDGTSKSVRFAGAIRFRPSPKNDEHTKES